MLAFNFIKFLKLKIETKNNFEQSKNSTMYKH